MPCVRQYIITSVEDVYKRQVFAVVFLLSAILYSSSEKKRIAAGKKEFANVLVLGGESGLQLRGIGGHFNDIKFPLEGKIIFGRDSAQCLSLIHIFAY